MKKLKLKALELSSAELLSKEQLKSTLRMAMGGYTITCNCSGGGGSLIFCTSTQECVEECVAVCG
jgi:hypothetical protein